MARSFFSFPNPVDDAAARTVATGVVVESVLALLTGWSWLLIPLTVGFFARVLSGPTWSPLGRFAVHVAAPRLPTLHKLVPGPPKRFAQGIGFVITATATVVWLTVGWTTARWIVLPLVVAASLEAFAGYCLGCAIFGQLMRWRLVPESVCADCADISRRLTTTAP
jgi:Domain of unknown function (DUF4395)